MSAELHVVCLCAQWCGSCRDWQPVIDTLSRTHPQWHWRWLDIEDDAALLGDLDVETLPTVLVARGERVLFYGPVLPRAELLERLLQTLSDADQPAGAVNGDVAALWRRLRTAG